MVAKCTCAEFERASSLPAFACARTPSESGRWAELQQAFPAAALRQQGYLNPAEVHTWQC
jgi:hypothetical protein